jgi:AraC family transcriptional regulator
VQLEKNGFRPSTGLRSYDTAIWYADRPRNVWTVQERHGTSAVLKVNDNTTEIEGPDTFHDILLFATDVSPDVRFHTFRISGENKPLSPRPRQIMVLPKGISTHVRAQGRYELLQVHFDCLRLRELTEDAAGGGFSLDLVHWLDDPAIGNLAVQLCREQASPGLANRSLVDALLIELGVMLVRRHSNLARHDMARAAPSLADERYRRIIDFAEANLQTDISIDDMARVACLSPFHFARAFKSRTGESPHRWLMRRRAERARDLLVAGRLAIAQVAAACGFSSQSHMNDVFRRLDLPTPGGLRASRTEASPSSQAEFFGSPMQERKFAETWSNRAEY